MKKWITIAGILFLTHPIAVLAEGYPYTTNITIAIPSNQQVLVSDAYETTNNTISALFGNLPTSSTISLWDTTAQLWRPLTKGRAGWGAGGTNRLTRGGVALVMSSLATNIYFSGAIPSAVSTAVYGVNGYTWIGYPYPADVAFTNTQIAKTAAIGDKVLFWTNNSWVAYSKLRSGWTPSVTNLVLKNCGAFAYFAYTNSVVYEPRP